MTSSGYNYDASGNTTYDAALRKFTYDAENKQVKAESTNSGQTVTGTLGEYVYDGDGKRVKKYVPSTGETTIFVYDAAGKQIAEYSTVVAPASVAKVAYTTTDHLGSPRVITDALGQVVSRRDFMPFGEDLNVGVGNRTGDTGLKYSMPGDNVRQKFTGYQKDNETQLDFAEARMYENRYGRFTAVDPLLASGKSANPQTVNRYVYCYNNPLTLLMIMVSGPRRFIGKWYERRSEAALSEIQIDQSLRAVTWWILILDLDMTYRLRYCLNWLTSMQ